jgi:two-component system phosphate regulon sensor histidine kinase PhoR
MWPVLACIALVALALVAALWLIDRRRAQSKLQLTIARCQDEERKAIAQEKIKRQTLFDGMVEGVLLVNEEGRVDFLNLSLKRLLGLTSDIRGKPLREALARPELDEMLGRISSEGQMVGLELDFPEPASRCLQVNASLFMASDGRHQGTIFIFHDLTRVKQFEATRREFVANVSHELRTPLSLIKGFVETLLGGAKDDPEQATRYLHTIDKHADRLTFLIEDLLTISRLESGQVLMNLQTVSLRELAARVIDDLQSRSPQKNSLLENQMPEDLCAQADADRLEQVFTNLIENAIKYGRAQGHVRIGGKMLPNNKVQVWVHDDGPGIPAEARERVFERFYRVDRARARETGGTGLGLSIVKHIVQAHGGEVWVQSEPGRGCTFFFTLPHA